ncbi:MAG: hypothetical protein KDA91_06680 [Planctomycetaceae bacterium]|nr:hypothetical protein [Planctomycetaceae bacterium]
MASLTIREALTDSFECILKVKVATPHDTAAVDQESQSLEVVSLLHSTETDIRVGAHLKVINPIQFDTGTTAILVRVSGPKSSSQSFVVVHSFSQGSVLADYAESVSIEERRQTPLQLQLEQLLAGFLAADPRVRMEILKEASAFPVDVWSTSRKPDSFREWSISALQTDGSIDPMSAEMLSSNLQVVAMMLATYERESEITLVDRILFSDDERSQKLRAESEIAGFQYAFVLLKKASGLNELAVRYLEEDSRGDTAPVTARERFAFIGLLQQLWDFPVPSISRQVVDDTLSRCLESSRFNGFESEIIERLRLHRYWAVSPKILEVYGTLDGTAKRACLRFLVDGINDTDGVLESSLKSRIVNHIREEHESTPALFRYIKDVDRVLE